MSFRPVWWNTLLVTASFAYCDGVVCSTLTRVGHGHADVGVKKLIGAIKLHRILVPCAHFEQMSSHLVYVRCLRRCRLHDGVLVVFHRTICPCVVGLWLLVFVRARWGILHGKKLG